MKFKLLITSIAAAALLAAGTARAQYGAEGGQWLRYGGDNGSTKYSALDQINESNVADLEVAWKWESADNEIAAGDRRSTPGGYKSTPIMIDGVLYVSTSLNLVVAINAETGEQLWSFDTESRKAGRPGNLGFNHRGVTYWADGDDKRIFMPTNNANLWAINAETGKAIESFGTGGKVDLAEGLGRPIQRRHYMVISAPTVVRDVVIVGSSIHDGPTHKEMPPGHVRAFDVRTGEQKWIFHTIPQKSEFGNDTWENDSWTYSGNTNVWTLMSADEELGYVYLPIGTPTNDWFGGHRHGDNLFAESLVCVDATTGERVWHFQMVHHGLWDYDLPAAPNLIDITVNGKKIKAVAQASKQGFLYVFDRVTGEPVWPIEERAVPASTVPGERAAPTQPFPTKPAPYEYQGISDDTLIDFTPELRAEAKELIAAYDYGPIFTPPTERGTINLPGWGGGANWTGAAADPETGMIYLPSSTGPMVVQIIEPPDKNRSNFDRIRGGSTFVRGPQGLPLTKPPYGRITAIDLNTGDHAWMVPHGDGIRQRLIAAGVPDPGPVGGGGTGPVLTKTLLFLGQGGGGGGRGRGRGRGGAGESPPSTSVLRAYDKATGEVVHAVKLPVRPSGTPMTYMSGGKQYIAMAYGGGADAGIIAVALP